MVIKRNGDGKIIDCSPSIYHYRKSPLLFSGTKPAQKKIFVVQYPVLLAFSEQNLKIFLIISPILRPVLSWDKLILDDFLWFFFANLCS